MFNLNKMGNHVIDKAYSAGLLPTAEQYMVVNLGGVYRKGLSDGICIALGGYIAKKLGQKLIEAYIDYIAEEKAKSKENSRVTD